MAEYKNLTVQKAKAFCLKRYIKFRVTFNKIYFIIFSPYNNLCSISSPSKRRGLGWGLYGEG